MAYISATNGGNQNSFA